MVGFHTIAMSLAALTAAPAAQPARDPGAAVAPLTSPAPRATTPATTDSRRYCVVDTLTGSRIARRVCQTRQTWLDQGFDPLAPAK